MESHEGQFYDALATLYNQDWGTVYLDTARHLFHTHLRPCLAPGAALLDLCCGTGQLAAALAAEGYRVTGVDLSPRMLDHARLNAPAAQFEIGEMSEYACDRRFDAAVCCACA